VSRPFLILAFLEMWIRFDLNMQTCCAQRTVYGRPLRTRGDNRQRPAEKC
jgi:hypothetical protein